MKFFQLGDNALSVEFGPKINLRTNERTLRFHVHLESLKWPGINELVSSYSAVTIYFNPLKINALDLITKLRKIEFSPLREREAPKNIHSIPVVYGGEFGPDLKDVAKINRLTPEEVVRIHTQCEFRVFMLGFMPGFPYCGIVPESIRTPRLATPRTRVPTGSVGIAGAQTGIYPMESPGGWRIIGRTPFQLFDPQSTGESMFLFHPGDQIKFYSISAEDFHARAN